MMYKILIFCFFIGMQLNFAQSSVEVQNKIISQFEHLIPKNTSFASWTMYEVTLDQDGKTDYVFSYILCNKYKRHIHAGSGVLLLKTIGKNKYKLHGHIPSTDKDIYTFTGYTGNTYFINEYSAESNYRKIKRKLKFQKKGDKLVSL